MSEYELLRQEILEDYKAITQYNLALFSIVSATLAFVLGREEYYLCLVPYLAIVPLFLLCEVTRKNICRIASYMAVFLEGEAYNWENRHQKLEFKKSKKRNWQSLFLYYFVGSVCSFTSIYKIWESQFDLLGKLIRSIVVCFLTLCIFDYMRDITIDYVRLRKSMMEDWKELKADEVNHQEMNYTVSHMSPVGHRDGE